MLEAELVYIAAPQARMDRDNGHGKAGEQIKHLQSTQLFAWIKSTTIAPSTRS